MADSSQPVHRLTCREYLAWRFGIGLPYLALLTDLAQINAGHLLPKIPRTAVEASIRLAAERARLLRGRLRLEDSPAPRMFAGKE